MPGNIIPISGLDQAGLIQDQPAVGIPPNAFSDARNVRFRDGAVRKMLGEQDILPGIFDSDMAAADGHTIKYVAWWPNPNRAPISGYYLYILTEEQTDGTYDDVVYITEPVAYSIGGDGRDENEIWQDFTKKELGRFEDVETPIGSYQHTFFQGGFSIIINNGLTTPKYVTDIDGNTDIDMVPDLQDLPGWDSYNINEVGFEGEYDAASQSPIFDLGQAYGFDQWQIRVRLKGTGTDANNIDVLFDSIDDTEKSGIILKQTATLTSVDFNTVINDTDEVTINIQSKDPVTVTAGVVRAFGDFLVAGNLVERDTDGVVLRNLAGVVRSSDVAAPGTIPANWNPYAAGVSTADEFVITADGVVQDMVELQGNLYLYSNSSISVMRKTNSTVVPLAVSTVTNSYGAQTTDAVLEFDGQHIVIGSSDIYAFGGHPGSIQSIAHKRVRHSFFDDLNTVYEQRLFMLRYTQRDEIWICYPSRESFGGDVDKALIWNYRDNNWTKKDLDGVVSGDIAPVPGGGVPSLEIILDSDSGNKGIVNLGAYEVQTVSINENAELPTVTSDGHQPQTYFVIDTDFPSVVIAEDSAGEINLVSRKMEYSETERDYIESDTEQINFSVKIFGDFSGSDKIDVLRQVIASQIDTDMWSGDTELTNIARATRTPYAPWALRSPFGGDIDMFHTGLQTEMYGGERQDGTGTYTEHPDQEGEFYFFAEDQPPTPKYVDAHDTDGNDIAIGDFIKVYQWNTGVEPDTVNADFLITPRVIFRSADGTSTTERILFQSGFDTENATEIMDEFSNQFNTVEEGWSTSPPTGYTQFNDNRRMWASSELRSWPGEWTITGNGMGNSGLTEYSLGLTLFENTRTDSERVTPSSDNDFRGAYKLRATPSYVGLRVRNTAVEGDVQLITVELGTAGDYDSDTQSGTNGQSLTPIQAYNKIEETILSTNETLSVTRETGKLIITPAVYTESANYVLSLVTNMDSESTVEFNTVYNEVPEGSRFGDTPLINNGDSEIRLHSVAPAAVVGTPDSQATPSDTRVPNRNGTLPATEALMDNDSPDSILVFDIDRPWAENEVNPNIYYPIFATAKRPVDADSLIAPKVNKVIVSDVGYTTPEFRKARRKVFVDGNNATLVVESGTNDEAKPYESYIERKQMALAPEFDTNELRSLVVHATGSTSDYFNGPKTYNKLTVRMEGTNAPEEGADLSEEMDAKQSQRQNEFYIAEDYKVDMRVHGRFINMRITDESFTSTGNETYEDRVYNQASEWVISTLQAETKTGGTR